MSQEVMQASLFAPPDSRFCCGDNVPIRSANTSASKMEMRQMYREFDVERLSHLIRRLVRETGIREQDARNLVVAIGAEWPSLVREARLRAA